VTASATVEAAVERTTDAKISAFNVVYAKDDAVVSGLLDRGRQDLAARSGSVPAELTIGGIVVGRQGTANVEPMKLKRIRSATRCDDTFFRPVL
jgi:hypothetical protein